MKTGVRVFVSLWYLLGWMAHVYLGLFAPETYRLFGDTALIPAYTAFWHSVVMPHITPLALTLAGFEVLVGLLLLGRGKWIKVGLTLSILFNLGLVQMGLGFPTDDLLTDLLVNRGPNLLFIALQLPLILGSTQQSVLDILRGRPSGV